MSLSTVQSGSANMDVDEGFLPPPPPISAAASPSTSTKHKIERSCITCHQRKIRCDKRSPCANCARHDLFCCYPAPERAGRRPPKTTIADVATRVSRLERTITALTKELPRDTACGLRSATTPPPESQPQKGYHPSEASPAQEILLQDGDSSRYVNEYLLSRVLDEEQDLKSAVSSPKAENPRLRTESSFDIGAIFSGFNKNTAADHDNFPSRFQASQLWQAFVNNVNPVIKILHIPTAQKAIFAAINNPVNIDKDLEALLFSVYFAAITSLPADNVAHLLEQPKDRALTNFRYRTEQSLAQADFLDTPSVRSLQAIAIYLACLRVYTGKRSLWTLYGLAVRSAQSIGLHRDGTNFKMSPFDTEIRRRLWWAISSGDSRAGEDHGISLVEQASDTQYPSNVDDRELSPDMKEIPASRQGCTEMTFFLVIIETGKVLQQLQSPVASSSVGSNEAARIKVVDDLVQHFKTTYLKDCDPNIPIQQHTLLMAHMMCEKLMFIIRLQSLKKSGFKNITFGATEETLNAACQILDYHLQMQLDGLLGNFHWLSETFVQYHMLTYVLWHLCMKPVGPSIARAWKVVDQSFEIASRRGVSAEVGSKWEVLEWLREKAVRVQNAQNAGLTLENASDVEDIPAMQNLNEHGNFDLELGDMQDWDMAALGFPDWNSLVGNFDMRGVDESDSAIPDLTASGAVE